MPAHRQCSRVDTMELKLQIVKNLGNKAAMKYFRILERYLGLGINKTQFQNLCYSTIGRENAKLHNRLINAILGNAHLAHAAQTQHYGDAKLSCGSVAQFTKLLRGSLGDLLEAFPRKARSSLVRRPRECWSSVGLKRKVCPSVNVEEARKSKERKRTEVVSVGGKARSVNAGEAQEKQNGYAGISLGSKSPCIAVQESCQSQEKLTGTEVISLGSKSPLINVQEACKAQEKQIGTDVITIGSKAASLNFHKVCKSPDSKTPSMNVREACKPQEEPTMISINSKALTTNAQVPCELQDEQIGSEAISGGTKAPSVNALEACQPEEKHISSAAMSIGIKAPSMNVQGACKPREMQIAPEVISLCTKAPCISAQEVCKSQEKQTSHQLMSIYREAPSVNAQEICKFHEKQTGHELIPAVNVQEVCTFPQKQTSPEVQSLGSKLTAEVIFVEDEDEVEQMRGSPYVQSRSPLMPPLGILKDVGGLWSRARNSATDFHIGSLMVSETCQRSGELPDTVSLMKRMEKKLEHEGLSLSPDCANVLNNALNAYMKRLIKPSVDLARSRHGKTRMLDLANARFNDTVSWQQAREQSMNQSCSASVLDFLVSVESNPKLLGVNWPVQLEKISVRSMEE